MLDERKRFPQRNACCLHGIVEASASSPTIVGDESAAEAALFGIDMLSAALPSDKVFNPGEHLTARSVPCDGASSLTQRTPTATILVKASWGLAVASGITRQSETITMPWCHRSRRSTTGGVRSSAKPSSLAGSSTPLKGKSRVQGCTGRCGWQRWTTPRAAGWRFPEAPPGFPVRSSRSRVSRQRLFLGAGAGRPQARDSR